MVSKVTIVKSETKINYCTNQQAKASFELEKDWIYICDEPTGLLFVKVPKNQSNSTLKIPASGGFPTYASVEGNLEDPESKIYNVSPYDFKIIQASIITHVEPVLKTIDNKSGAVITRLSGEKEKAAQIACQEKSPVEVFETEKSAIYVCIQNQENNENAIGLTYVQMSKINPNEKISLPAKLTSNFSYQTVTNQEVNYIISYQGLETYKNDQKINTEPVTNVYLVPPIPSDNGYDN
jgi:hypothetical protein